MYDLICELSINKLKSSVFYNYYQCHYLFLSSLVVNLKSSTMENNCESEILSPTSPNKTTIFVRRTNKQAVKIKVSQPINIDNLKGKVSELFHLSLEGFALFYNGERIDSCLTLPALGKNRIIHLIDLSNTQQQQITLHFKEVSKPESTFDLKLKSDRPIRSLIEEDLKPHTKRGRKEIFLVYLGKVLDNSKSLMEELIEDQSEILIVEFKKTHKESFRTVNLSHQKMQPILRSSTQLLSPQKGPRLWQEEYEDQRHRKETFQKDINRGKKKKEAISLQKIDTPEADNQEDVVQIQIKMINHQLKTYRNAPRDEMEKEDFIVIEQLSKIQLSEKEYEDS